MELSVAEPRIRDVLAEREWREFADGVFAPLSRADQRRAGEAYVQGLLHCTGRKSIRRLAATVPGRNEQSLQQFINQSPWDSDTIRRRVLHRLLTVMPPVAWFIEEVAFPKHGRYSAGVERQYVPSLGKVCNAQVAIAVHLTTGEHSVPINWRLTVPESWGHDTERRHRARMPPDELPRPYWQYYLEALDDMALDWGLPHAPVVADSRNRNEVETLLLALGVRSLPYVVEVGPRTNVRWFGAAGPSPRGPGESSRWTVEALSQSLADRLPKATVGWRDGAHGTTLRSQFLQVPVRLDVPDQPLTRNLAPQTLLVEWPFGKPAPRGFWITNHTDATLQELVELAKLRTMATAETEKFAARYGLRDYEGRAFIGWHHHVTLATVAYAYDLLQLQRAGGA